MRVVRIAKFVEEEDNINWLVAGLLPDAGWTLLVGTAGCGKSTFATQLCMALQLGKPFMGRETIQTDILFVQADAPPLIWKEMLKRIAPKSVGFTLVDVPAKCLGNPQYVQSLGSLAAKIQPKFIVFDSLYNLTNVPINTESVLTPVQTMKELATFAVVKGKVKSIKEVTESDVIESTYSVPWLLIHHPPHN